MYEVIEHYKAENFGIVLLAYCSIFINFVSCCVPGTGCLCILAAPIFGPYFGFLIMHTCALIGAVNCYLISMQLGAGAIQAKFPDKFGWF